MGIKLSLLNLYFKQFGLDMIGSLCNSMPSVCHHWHDQMKLSDAFSRNFDNVNWTPLTRKISFFTFNCLTSLVYVACFVISIFYFSGKFSSAIK